MGDDIERYTHLQEYCDEIVKQFEAMLQESVNEDEEQNSLRMKLQ